jgi:hypothetical protein
MIQKNLNYILTIIFFFISLWVVSYHEMWRDEFQSWFLARDSNSLKELFHNLKYEGHTSLWYLILFPITRIFSSPTSMQYIHIFIATISIFILFKWSPFNLLQKTLLAFGYFLFYEYSIIARNYAVSILLIFVFCALFNKRKTYPLSLALVLFLLCHTNIFGIMFALSFFFMICIEDFLKKKKDFYFKLPKTYLMAFIIILLAFITSITQIIPPSDSSFASAWNYDINFRKISAMIGRLVNGYFPIPNFNVNSWNSNIFYLNEFSQIIGLTITVITVCIFSIFFISRPSVLFHYYFIIVSLLLFFLIKYDGSTRHHGFFFIGLISSLWIYSNCQNFRFSLILINLKEVRKKIINSLFNLLLIIQLFISIISISQEYKYPFSGGKETAEFLNNNNLANSQIIGHPTALTLSVLGYMKNIKFYDLSKRKLSTFFRHDYEVYMVNYEILYDTSLKLASSSDKVILILNQNIEDTFGYKANQNFYKIFESANAIVKSEKFYVYIFLN